MNVGYIYVLLYASVEKGIFEEFHTVFVQVHYHPKFVTRVSPTKLFLKLWIQRLCTMSVSLQLEPSPIRRLIFYQRDVALRIGFNRVSNEIVFLPWHPDTVSSSHEEHVCAVVRSQNCCSFFPAWCHRWTAATLETSC